MRRILFSCVAAVLLALCGCGGAGRYDNAQPGSAASGVTAESAAASRPASSQQQAADTSLVNASAAQSAAEAAGIERKIIRNAELTLESENPEEAFRKVASLAESRGGFVVTSEATQAGANEAGRATVTVVVRVPAAQFDSAVEEIRKLGGRVLQDKRTGQDVTEEYIDLEARLRAKRALEAQFLEIMKQAQKVSEALEVQRQLSEVRSEIEQIEGRRRFLESQSSLSTIKATVRPPVAIVATSAGGFFSGIREAVGDGVGAAAAIILVMVRIVIALIPILLLVVLPAVWAGRYVIRRIKRARIS